MEDALYVALSALGIYGYVQSGGVLNLSVLMPFIYSIAGEGVDLHGYITQDEEAGTTTISADFVNLVLQAYKQYQKENGAKFNGTLKQDTDDMYYIYGETVHTVISTERGWNYVSYISDFKCAYPVALLYFNNSEMVKYTYWGTSIFDRDWGKGTGCLAFFYNGNSDSTNGGINLLNNYFSMVKEPANPFVTIYRDGEENSTSSNFSVFGCFGEINDIISSVSSSTIPVYTSFDLMVSDLQSGKYTHADNYGKMPECETPAYTGTYEGGDITVPTEKLEGIQDKLDEIDKTDKDIYEKLKELLEWLLGNGGIGGGTDVTATNSWLEKIYLKVCQIFDKISETATGAVDTVNTKLQETLDEILNTLKSIRRWTIADTVFDGVDALADVASLLKDFLTAPAAAIGTAASSLGETANMLTDKFPFSIPWDMAALVTLLSAEPQAPVFKLPIAIESVGIEEYIEIDMSQFEYLSTIMRGMLSILYAYGILSMTTKVMDIGGKK